MILFSRLFLDKTVDGRRHDTTIHISNMSFCCGRSLWPLPADGDALTAEYRFERDPTVEGHGTNTNGLPSDICRRTALPTYQLFIWNNIHRMAALDHQHHRAESTCKTPRRCGFVKGCILPLSVKSRITKSTSECGNPIPTYLTDILSD